MREGGALSWRGVMSDIEPLQRRMGILILIIVVAALIFTQLGFIAVGSTRYLLVLAPIAIGSLLYGTLPGAAIGTVAGLAFMIHALVLPLDLYEKLFATPMHSVIPFGLTGLLLGLLFSHLKRISEKGDWAGLAGLTLFCFIGSWFCSNFFQISVYISNVVRESSLPTEFFSVLMDFKATGQQILVDAIAMTVTCVGASLALRAGIREVASERSIRLTFQRWLLVVIVIAFMITEALLFSFITVLSLADAEAAIDGHLEYISSQLDARDSWLDQFFADGADADLAENAARSSIVSLASDLKLWETGITVIAEDNVILSASDPAFKSGAFDEVIGKGIENGFKPSLFTSDEMVDFFMADRAEGGYLKAIQVDYEHGGKKGTHQVAAILPAEVVFEYRGTFLAIIGTIFLLLFALVYMLAMRLLDRVVVKNIDATNEMLGRITDGDLETTVDIRDSLEFNSLSTGINTTVSALKDSIYDAQTRIDRELATSKAIQKSALPQVFPPFPEIDRFDIYASMNPAREVGGDFYDFFMPDDNSLAMVMADVSGKGIPAALFMMSAKTEIAACLQAGMELSEAVETANWRLCQGNDAGMFVTAFVAILDINTGALSYVNAGHNPPLIRRRDSWEWLRDKSGTFIGAFETVPYKTFHTTLKEGDELLMYTDGVTECMDPDEQLYGEDRLESFLDAHEGLHPRKLIESVSRDLERYANGAEQSDDITMLAVEFGQAPEVSASTVLPARLDQLPKATAFIHGELTRRMCPISVQNKIDICLEELFVNVASYAYPDATDDKPGKVRISYIFTPDPQGITIEISDEGIPFDPLAKPDPTAPESIEDARIGGLGIMMTKQLSDDISYLYVDDCNVTAFTKRW